MWCRLAALPAPGPGAQLQISLIDYLDAVLKDGGSRSTAEYAVAAVRSIFPTYSGKAGLPMPRVDRAMRGSRRVTPARSRFPMPMAVTAAIAVSFMALGDWQCDAQILLTHYTATCAPARSTRSETATCSRRSPARTQAWRSGRC